MKEIWKDIKGYEGLYQVSNLGQVRSLNYKRSGKIGILKSYNNIRYKTVTLSLKGKLKNFTIHGLMGKMFLNNINLQVNHKDGNKHNNFLNNLELVTSSENNLHKFRVLGYKNHFQVKHCKPRLNKGKLINGMGVTQWKKKTGGSNRKFYTLVDQMQKF